MLPDINELMSYEACKFGQRVHARRQVNAVAFGEHDSPFRGQGLDFDAVREYVPGDDIRSIDWRVTARTGSPHVKLFKEEKERHTIICVDMNAAMRFGTRNTFKSIQAARCAAILGWRALAHQDRISACLFGDVPNGLQYSSSKRSRKALGMLLKTIAEPFRERHHVSLETVLQHVSRAAHPGSLIYLISDFMALSPDFSKASGLSGLCKSCDVVFISINDAADQALVPAGVLGFCGREKIYFNTDNSKGRQAYAAQWEANRHLLHNLTKNLKIPLIALSTESELPRDLLLDLTNLAKRKKCQR